MIREDYVTFEQAKALRELGFNWKCFGFYFYDNELVFGGPRDYNLMHGYISAPALSQTQKWFREVKKIEVNANYDNVKEKWYWFINDMQECNMTTIDDYNFDTYEQALSEGIDKALELLKQ